VRLGPWLVESFVEGPEVQIDGVVRAGTVVFFGISAYAQNLVDVHQGGIVASITLPPAEHHDLYEQARPLIARSLTALGHRDGVFHMEAFRSPDGLVFSECAARVGGCRTDEMVLAGFGVDLHDEWARAVLALPPDTAAKAADALANCVGDLNLTAPPGRITVLPALDEVLSQPGVLLAELTLTVGDSMPDCTQATNLSAGQALVCGDDPEHVEARMRNLLSWFHRHTTVEPA
jgi:phosphoribosylaminoimidazole carboxylase (NCAIR synthetase)